MKTNSIKLHSIFFVLLSSFLSACTEGGIGGTGYTNNKLIVGVVTKIDESGQLKVGDVALDTSSSTISIDEKASQVEQIKPGMVASIDAKVSDDGLKGVADTIVIDNVVEGPITAIHTDSIIVMKQRVQINSETLFDKINGVAEYSVGDIVEINGFVEGDGQLVATRVDVSDEQLYEIKGYTRDFDAASNSLFVGELKIDLSQISLGAGVNLGNGSLIEIEGSYNSETQLFVVRKIEIKQHSIAEGVEYEFRGYVKQVNSSSEFVIENLIVQTNTDTELHDVIDGQITVGMLLEIEGYLQNGILIAEEIEQKTSPQQANPSSNETSGEEEETEKQNESGSEEADKDQESKEISGNFTVEFESNIMSVDIANNKLMLAGYVTPFYLITDSQFEGGYLDISDVAVGHFARIRAGKSNTGDAVVVQIEHKGNESSEDVRLRGQVSFISQPYIGFFNDTIDVTAMDVGFDSLSGFFTALSLGDTLDIQGEQVNNHITWTQLEIK